MLGENIKILRKQKGLSQETLAQQLNVVRQTVSKWEKGYSVPDAEMLNTLSELFEVPVSTLLGSTIAEEEKTSGSAIEEIAKQLAILNEQLASKTARRRKIAKRTLLGVLIAVVLLITVWCVCFFLFGIQPRQNAVLTTTCIEGTLNGEAHAYSFTYDENYRIHAEGGDTWITDHIPEAFNYGNANTAISQIEDYFTEHGGTVKITEGAD